MDKQIIVIGAGAAGLSAALTLAEKGIKVLIVSEQPSERAQSVMAEGGLNAAVITDETGDSPAKHAEETIQAGRNLASQQAVEAMTAAAPAIVDQLYAWGMSWTLNEQKQPQRRAFGGQKYQRTAFAADSTGKQLMHTLTEQVRRYEAEGLVERKTGWLFFQLLYDSDETESLKKQAECYAKKRNARGCVLYHPLSGRYEIVHGTGVIIASGGLNGLFGNATGSVKNSGYVTASLFADGIPLANGEFIQYHPTTVNLHAKCMLITEAVRGEGGRLFIEKDGKPYYFMEEKYPELGNLMPRDVVSREEWQWMSKGYEIWLDMRGMDEEIYQHRLLQVVEACQTFLGIDPTKEPIPVKPGIHYFMGGILVDRWHRTEVGGLYAAGECACQYHGANRLGGNSLLGAIYGGQVAAKSSMDDLSAETVAMAASEARDADTLACLKVVEATLKQGNGHYAENLQQLQMILKENLGIIRDGQQLQKGLEALQELSEKMVTQQGDKQASMYETRMLSNGCLLGEAMILSALSRKESRGAHQRLDYPEESEAYQKTTVARYTQEGIQVTFEVIDGDE